MIKCNRIIQRIFLLSICLFFNLWQKNLMGITLDSTDKSYILDHVNPHLKFLKEHRIDLFKLMIQGPDEISVKRYLMWLNLWAQDQSGELNPPTDIKMIWYLHMLNAQSYQSALNSIANFHDIDTDTLASKPFIFEDSALDLSSPCFFLWVPFQRPTPLQQSWLNAYGLGLHQKRKVVDLEYKVGVELIPKNFKHFLLKANLNKSYFFRQNRGAEKINTLKRYLQYTSLYENHRQSDFYPTLDIELVMLTHRLNNRSYMRFASQLIHTKFDTDYYELGPKTIKRKMRSSFLSWYDAYLENIETGACWHSFDGKGGTPLHSENKFKLLHSHPSTVYEAESERSFVSSIESTSIRTTRHRRSSYDDLPDDYWEDLGL